MHLTNLFTHLHAFTAAARKLGAEGEFRLGDLRALLRAGDRQVEFLAQYLVRRPDRTLTYAMQFGDDAEGFIGWLPYFNKRWVEAYDKLAFKQFCARHGLPVPAWSVGRVAPELGDFVIKSARGSSFGQRMRGPFAAGEAASSIQAATPTHTLAEGEYADQFIPGRIGKAWFWNDQLVTLALREPGSVVGDGHATLAQLVRRQRRSADLTVRTDFFRYRGLDWDQVPAAGETVTVDYKYGSPFERYDDASPDRLAELRGTPLVAWLSGWAPLFWQCVPQSIREGTLYTVDFIDSDTQGIRLLEMNCNPMVPPEAYELILGAAFSGAVAGADSMQLIAAPPSSAESPPEPPLLQPMPWTSPPAPAVPAPSLGMPRHTG